MNAILRGALLALVCSLCIYTVTATAPSCVKMGATVGDPYNNCTELCCQDGVKKYDDTLQTCCHDGGTTFCQAFGMKCCTPTPAITVTAKQQPRACYVDGPQGCCSYQTQPSIDTTTSVSTTTYTAKTYFTDTQQCCTAPNNGYFNGNDPIVPKYVSSCLKYMTENTIKMYCFADTDCPTGGKCCRTPQQPSQTTVGSYNKNTPGTCYDPNFNGCCGGGTGVKMGDPAGAATMLYNQTYYDAQVYDPKKELCCTFPVAAGKLVSTLGNGCPCFQNSDCPSANYTCCAPSEAELATESSLTTGTEAKATSRYVKCDAGCPTKDAPGPGISYFPGCYGKCILSTTANQFSNQVCLTSTGLGDRCPNLRVLSATGTFDPPTLTNLITTESDAHWKDCCPSGTDKSFSVLYDTRNDYCCPVIGTRMSGKQRGLSPTVRIQPLATQLTTSADNCMCSQSSDCPNGQTCCLGANLGTNAGSAKANLNYGNYTGLCYDERVTACCGFQTDSDFTTRFYDPSVQQCCKNGLNPIGTACDCHSDSDCGGPHQACCISESREGNATHEFGSCYDTRTASCCQSYPGWMPNFNLPWDPATNPIEVIEDSRVTATFSVATVYDNTSKVCCKWNGPQINLNLCECRYDRNDCPNKAVCCASNGTQAALNPMRTLDGRCYNPEKDACCVSNWLAPSALPAIYDKERQVCCPNNGVAADHRMCQCSSDAHCPAKGECCLDGEARENGINSLCLSATSTCIGRCIHTDIETCCDDPTVSEFAIITPAMGAIPAKLGKPVQACAKDYQKCCDGQCCNKAVETCKKTTINRQASATGTTAYGYPTGVTTTYGYHYGIDQEYSRCTVTEHSSPSIVFHTWVFPTFLSVAGILFIVFGAKTALGTDISPNMIKMALVGISIFVGIMSLLLLWSPLWKYGFVIIVANKVILSLFGVGGVWPKRFAVAIAVVCFLWVVEPFGSNSILNFGTVTYAGNTQTDSAGANGNWYNAHGLNYAARLLQRPRDDDDGSDACTQFYQYWMVDTGLHDARGWNPKGTTRGICRRSWMHTITVMAGLITPFQTIFLLLSGLALARSGY